MASNNNFPTNPFNDQYSSLTRPIKVYLPNKKGDDNDDFVGRERLMERLFNWLSDSTRKSASYLVTGFRGMGKTSIVDRVTNRLTREVNEKTEPWWLLLTLIPVVVFGVVAACLPLLKESKLNWLLIISLLLVGWLITVCVLYKLDQSYFKRKKKRARKKYPNHGMFDNVNVDKMVRGKNEDEEFRSYHNIKISINLGHEVLKERDVLSMIATSVRDKYKAFVRSVKPHLAGKSVLALSLSLLSIGPFIAVQNNFTVNNTITVNNETSVNINNSPVTIREDVANSQRMVVSGVSENSHNQQIIVNGHDGESWVSRMTRDITQLGGKALADQGFVGVVFRILSFILLFVVFKWICGKLFRLIPYYSTPVRVLHRLDILTERLNTITGEETNVSPTANTSAFTVSLFNRRRQKTTPIADIREIETELSEIMNMINSDKCVKGYQANFIVVFDEMDKIDPAMMGQHKSSEMPEFTDSVKGFPDGMDSRERRRNVLKLLANIKLFVSTARAKFVFISGRELYDAFLADLSDRDFAISSIFSGVINVDSFLTPEGGQTDVRSMSEWYITNRLIPKEWLEKVERKNAEGRHGQGEANDNWAVLKQEKPSLRWYYEYLIDEVNQSGLPEDEKKKRYQDVAFVIGFLRTFAAYLTHISNGSPKKIFLYFEKHIRKAEDCQPMNDWGDICAVGDSHYRQALWFDTTQQKTINFVHYLSNPIMDTITNDMSGYGDRFLVSLSFIIDHIYKHHNRSFSWRNMEQIPDLLRVSKAPELRDEVMSIMEYLTQVHISPVLIGLNEYKFHKSIAEEISIMSKISDEASAIFNFTLDESLSVIQHNTRMLNHYIELEKADKENKASHQQYLPIIARIHSNLGDLHYWDEDYYAASLEYRAAIITLPKDQEDDTGFITRVRCLLKLGLTYEFRKLYPNAYQTYCQLINQLVSRRWVNEKTFGLSVMDARTKGWQNKRQVMVHPKQNYDSWNQNNEQYAQQFHRPIFEGDYTQSAHADYSVNFDGIISTFADDLTVEKSKTINSLTLFEEIRYLYQAVLAKLGILENLGMSGITQTNIDVAEGEFRTLHKSVNFREKFIIAADFFRKLAEILYYKNSLTILTQEQDTLFASVYYDDHNLLANIDDYCMRYSKDAFTTKHAVKTFFNYVGNSASESDKKFEYSSSGNGTLTLQKLYEKLLDYLNRDYSAKPEQRENIKGYLEYNIQEVKTNKDNKFYYTSVEACEHHCKLLRKKGFRTPCYACKYYTRSLRILAENMFADKKVLDNQPTKAYGILKSSFKSKLLYTNAIHLRTLAQTLEGFGNVMCACASNNKYEDDKFRPKTAINPKIIHLLKNLCETETEEGETTLISTYEQKINAIKPLSRLDKSILYFWDAYRFYLMGSYYHEAVGCLNKIIQLMVNYVEVLCYSQGDEKSGWDEDNEVNTVEAIIGSGDLKKSFLSILFQRVVRHVGCQYDHTNLNEINELKWIFSKDFHDNVDLTRLSVYPDIRTAWLRIVEIYAKGLWLLLQRRSTNVDTKQYTDFIKEVYPLITPKRRYEVTTYEEVLGHYTKMRFNDHVLNNLMDGNPLLENSATGYSPAYHVLFYERLLAYLRSGCDEERLDKSLFNVGADVQQRLQLVEYLIHDTLVCVTRMAKTFTQHSHLTSYSKSFIGIVYNFYWEWSRKYELLYSLYQYKELKQKGNTAEADNIIHNMWDSSSVQNSGADEGVLVRLRTAMRECSKLIAADTEEEAKYGSRSNRMYERLRHDIDDISVNTIYSNFTAEMALKYYTMAVEANTEGEAYKEMMGSMHFLNDDLNNDTCQFNIACERFLLNSGIIDKQRQRLERLYKGSNAYNLRKAYIDGPNNLSREDIGPNRFDRSQFINSEY